jgi:hypothetical protein
MPTWNWTTVFAVCGLLAVGTAAVGQTQSDTEKQPAAKTPPSTINNPSVSAPYPQAPEKAPPDGGAARLPSNYGANTQQTNRGGNCDSDTLVKDAEYCFDVNRAGYNDLFDGSCNKSRDKTEAGFFACQSHNERVRKSYSSCSPEQQIDLVRTAGRNRHAYANLFACGF